MNELLRFKEHVLEQIKADPEFRPTFDTRQVLLAGTWAGPWSTGRPRRR
jgi:hypothetical protein